MQFFNRTRAHGIAGGVDPPRARDEAGVADGDGLACTRISSYDGAVVSDDDFEIDAIAAANINGFAQDLRASPLAFELIIQSIAVFAEALDEEILGIGIAVGHAPGHVLVVAEVENAGDAGDRVADDLEVGAGQVGLVVDRGRIEAAVRIAGDQRQARIGVFAGDRPGVGAGVGFVEPVGFGGGDGKLVEAVHGLAGIFSAGRDGQQVALRIAFEEAGDILGADGSGVAGAPEFGLESTE